MKSTKQAKYRLNRVVYDVRQQKQRKIGISLSTKVVFKILQYSVNRRRAINSFLLLKDTTIRVNNNDVTVAIKDLK